jgi:hypothetical protein
MARDQRFVGAAEVEFEAAPDSVKAVLAGHPLDERGAHDAVTARESDLAAEGQAVLAAEVAVADIRIPVVGSIILGVDVVEETGADVETLREYARGHGPRLKGPPRRTSRRNDRGDGGCGIDRVAELDPGDAFQRQPPPIDRAFAGDLRDPDAALLIPFREAAIDAKEALPGLRQNK